MPSLPPFFNGNITGVFTVSVSDISWYKNGTKVAYVLLEWSGSHDKQKLLTSKLSKITYNIRTSYKSFLYYLSTCTLKCSIKSCESKKSAFASTKNLFLTESNPLVKALPLIVANEEIVGILQLCFNLQTFSDTSFDNDIKYLTQFGIQSKVLNNLDDNDFYHTEMVKSRKHTRPISVSSSNSSKTTRSKEELACDYLMGKDMGLDEEEEALSTLKTMPSAEKIVDTAEKTDIFSEFPSQLQIQGRSKILTDLRPGVNNVFKNINPAQTNVRKQSTELIKSEMKNAPVSKDNVYLHLSILSINIYRAIKSFQSTINNTFIVQCLKDQEPFRLLRFMSRHVDNNVVQFKNATNSSRLDGFTAKGITIKVYVRLLSQRFPIVLGETKQMLDWTGFSTILNGPRCVKIPIWNNDKITGHLSLSYEFSKMPSVQSYKDNFSELNVDNLIEINDSPKKPQLSECFKISGSFETQNKIKTANYKTISSNQMDDNLCTNDKMYPRKNVITNQLSYAEWSKKKPNKIVKENKEPVSITVHQRDNQRHLYDKMYPEKDVDIIESQFNREWAKTEPTKVTKAVQTNFEVRQFNKSVQTHLKTSNIAIQVDNDELLEDPLDNTVCCDVQNIFRCTHEFTFNIEKKCNSSFNYVTYQFPECVTNNTGKVITCCRLFRTFGNTNILHLITLPATISLDTYLYKYYKKAAIVLSLYQSDNCSLGKVSLLVSHLTDMANEFKNTHVTKNFVLFDNLSTHKLSNNKVYIDVHYKRVYHSFPSPKKHLKYNLCSKRNSSKQNPKCIVDLTGSDSEDGSINRTYTLFKHNDRFAGENNIAQTNSMPVNVFHSFKTRTESNSTQTDQMPVDTSCNLKTRTESSSTQTEMIPIKISRVSKTCTKTNSSQTVPLPLKTLDVCNIQTELEVPQQCLTVRNDSDTDKKNLENVTVKNISGVHKNQTCSKFQQASSNFDAHNSDIFKAKVTIVCGYNFPMVKLIGNNVPTAPTTCIIMKDHGEHSFSTPTNVETTNPVWNCKWTVELPKNTLIKGEWLMLQLWCKKYKNEYAGHNVERDIRLGFVIINVCALDYNFNQTGGLYDVISETEEHCGQVKVSFNPIDSQNNYWFKSKQAQEKTAAVNITDNTQKSNNYLIIGMLEEMQIENNCSSVTNKKSNIPIKDDTCRHYVDLTDDFPQKAVLNPINCVDSQNNEHCTLQQINKKTVVDVKEKEKKSKEKYVNRNYTKRDCTDLTVDSLQKDSQNSSQNTLTEGCQIDCLSNNGYKIDSRSVSSITSWTSSSNEILCSKNSWVTNTLTT